MSVNILVLYGADGTARPVVDRQPPGPRLFAVTISSSTAVKQGLRVMQDNGVTALVVSLRDVKLDLLLAVEGVKFDSIHVTGYRDDEDLSGLSSSMGGAQVYRCGDLLDAAIDIGSTDVSVGLLVPIKRRAIASADLRNAGPSWTSRTTIPLWSTVVSPALFTDASHWVELV